MKTYFPLHGIDQEDFFEFWDILIYVEGAIYQLDELNEQIAAGTAGPATINDVMRGVAVIKDVLEAKGLLTDAVRGELDDGLQFWEQERVFGAKMLANSKVPPNGHSPPLFFMDDVLAAAAKKSFDYRVLHLLLHALRDMPPSKDLLEFLLVDEKLVDLGDDLSDYEDDVCSNSFNIYRLYVHLYGRKAPLRLVERISALETRHAELLGHLPTQLQDIYKTRMANAAEAPGALRWTFPTPILNESAYRAEHSNS